jgi:uncharacterized metal-binding protein YceD (DUF177 family)
MSLLVNLSQLHRKSEFKISGELDVKDLGITGLDDCIEPRLPLKYDFEISMQEDGFLVQGRWNIQVSLTCVRCLKSFAKEYQNEDWSAFGVLSGEDKLSVVNDCVDLTPLLREDILLAFPLHPVCENGCEGLQELPDKTPGPSPDAKAGGDVSSVWDELDKLKL